MCKWKLERKMSKMTCWWVFFHSCHLYTHLRFLFCFQVKCFNFDRAHAQIQCNSKYLGSDLTPIQVRGQKDWFLVSDDGTRIEKAPIHFCCGKSQGLVSWHCRRSPHASPYTAWAAVGPGSCTKTTSATSPPCFSTGVFLLYSPSSLPVSGNSTNHFHSWHHTVI